MRGRNITSSQIAEMRRRKKAGERASEIAKKLGLSEGALSQHAGDIPGPGSHTKLTPDVVKKIRRLKREGHPERGFLTLKQIGEEVGVADGTVGRYTKDIPSKVLPEISEGGTPYTPDRKITYRVIANKAREYMFSRRGSKPTGSKKPSREDWRKATQWYDDLSPVDKVDAESIFHQRAVLTSPARKVLPYNKLPQVHHWGGLGEGFPHSANPDTMGLLDFDAHREVHRNPDYKKFVSEAKDQGLKTISAQPLWMTNLPEATKSLLAENVLPILRKAKPAAKVLSRAIPGLGISLSAKAASDYSKAGQDKLAAAAAMSAVPGPLGWLGLAGEMGGLLWNKATEDPNFLFGPLDKRRHIPRRRGSL